MNKPVDLVVANVMHEGSAFNVHDDEVVRAAIEIAGRKADTTNIKNVKRALAEMVARKLLCEISHQCSTKTVMAALKAVKAPSSIDDILEGLQAVEDRNK